MASFLEPRRRVRFLDSLDKPRLRRKLVNRLPHFGDLDPRFARVVSHSEDVDGIDRMLVAAGAPPLCWVMSSDRDLDGKCMPLAEALSAIVFHDHGGLISCIPGRLALFSSEAPGDQWILTREH